MPHRLMVESVANYGIFALNLGGTITVWSPGALAVTGYTAPEAVGMGYHDLFAPGCRHQAGTHIGRALEDGTCETSGPRVRKDGTMIEVASTLSVMAEDGVTVGLVGVMEDITRVKAYQNELRVAKERAERESAGKEHFLSVISHELRTPLTPVLMTLSHLGTTILPEEEEMRGMLAMMKCNLDLEVHLIDDLLDVMRILHGKATFRWEELDAHEMLRVALDFCSSAIRTAEVTLDLDLRARESLVHADAARLQQAFWNLIQNATKFTSKGELHISSENRRNTVVLDFRDTGIGITQEQMPRIFNAFEQGENSLVRRFGGLGLGLAIGRSVIEAHGGTIQAISTGEGCGSTFRVTLPVAQPHDPPWSPVAVYNEAAVH